MTPMCSILALAEPMAPVELDVATWIRLIADLGAYGLLAGVLFWLGPRALKEGREFMQSAHTLVRESRAAYEQQIAEMRREVREDRDKFVAALDRNSEALRSNTVATQRLCERMGMSHDPE